MRKSRISKISPSRMIRRSGKYTPYTTPTSRYVKPVGSDDGYDAYKDEMIVKYGMGWKNK